MQFPENWLRTLVDPKLGTAELVQLLTMAGLEVEECRAVAPPFSGVVVGKVLSVEQHPNADKLKICEVDVGAARPLRIVCGAPNVAQGMNVACALVGARLPGSAAGPLEIKAAAVRGEESRGMLCSGRELGLSDDHSGLLALSGQAPIGRNVREVLGLDD